MNRADRRRAQRQAQRQPNDSIASQRAILDAVEDAAETPIPLHEWTPEMLRYQELLRGAEPIPGEPTLMLTVHQMITVTRANKHLVPRG